MLFYHECQEEEQLLERESLLDANLILDDWKRGQRRHDYFNVFLSSLIASEEYCFISGNDPMELNSSESGFGRSERSRHDSNNNLYPMLDESINKIDPAEVESNLLGLFVVSFDARLGNLIEWQIPTDINLSKIEFKAMASGFHLMPSDIVLVVKRFSSFIKLWRQIFIL